MMKNMIRLIVMLSLTSCGQRDKFPDKLKSGLLHFKVNKSAAMEQIDKGNLHDIGALWVGFNRINAKISHDTLTVEVNIKLSTPLNYDGGFEVAHDTLFLYAKRLEKADMKEPMHSTLTYKILLKELTYKGIEFKEYD